MPSGRNHAGYVLIPALFLLLAGAPARAGVVFHHDGLAACLTARAADLSHEGNIVSARTDFRLKKPIGECGCFSALVSYQSSIVRDGTRRLLLEGLIGVKNSGQRTLVLAADPALVADGGIDVHLGCAPPS